MPQTSLPGTCESIPTSLSVIYLYDQGADELVTLPLRAVSMPINSKV